MNLLTLDKNVQIYPSKIRIIPNDKIGKSFFNLSYLAFDGLVNGKTGNIIEKKNFKKVGDIHSSVGIKVTDGFSVTEPFDLYDGAVLSVCISEWVEGNRYTTPSIIFRGLSGKVGRGDAEASKYQYTEILKSVEKLMRTQATFNLTEVCENLGYNDGYPKKLVSTILPCQYLENITINGKHSTIIYFTAESPLLTIANLKNGQLLSFDSTLLNIPHQQNTRLNVMIKTYAIIRVMEIEAHHLTPIITFDDLFKKCRIENADKKIKQRARLSLIDFLTNLQSKSVIKSLIVEKKGARFRAIRIFY